jgi:hypothetical protein
MRTLKASVRVFAMSSGSESLLDWMEAARSKHCPASRSGGNLSIGLERIGTEELVLCFCMRKALAAWMNWSAAALFESVSRMISDVGSYSQSVSTTQLQKLSCRAWKKSVPVSQRQHRWLRRIRTPISLPFLRRERSLRPLA